jgi:hypothetical protein
MVNNEKKWTMMNPISHRMKKCSPSSEQNGQLVHWWLLVHFGLLGGSLKFQRIVDLNSLKKFRIKEPLVQIILETLKN